MRDVKRIPMILKRLEEIWAKHPDLRLGQLIENFRFCLNQKKIHIYGIEDEEFIEELEEVYVDRSN